jgi:hypothetical protein
VLLFVFVFVIASNGRMHHSSDVQLVLAKIQLRVALFSNSTLTFGQPPLYQQEFEWNDDKEIKEESRASN